MTIGNELKTVSQLRAKGESSRFLDEFDYLVEGLDAEGELPVRRARWVASFFGGRCKDD